MRLASLLFIVFTMFGCGADIDILDSYVTVAVSFSNEQGPVNVEHFRLAIDGCQSGVASEDITDQEFELFYGDKGCKAHLMELGIAGRSYLTFESEKWQTGSSLRFSDLEQTDALDVEVTSSLRPVLADGETISFQIQ